METFFTGMLGFTGTFTPWLLLAIFVITLVAEFGLFVPYLLESIWLISGYNVGTGLVSPLFLVALCVVGVIGREVGSGALFYASSMGSPYFRRLYQKSVGPGLSRGLSNAGRLLKKSRLGHRLWKSASSTEIHSDGKKHSLHLFGKVFHLSPFTVALGRFLWMRLPITVALGVKKDIGPLVLGVALFSAVADGIYIVFGLLGGVEGLNHIQMLVYPLGIMALIFGAGYCLRWLSRRSPRQETEVQ